MAKSDVVTTLTLVAKIPRKSLQKWYGSMAYETGAQNFSFPLKSKYQHDFRNYYLGHSSNWVKECDVPVHLSLHCFGGYLSVKSQILQQEVEPLTHRMQFASSPWVRQGPTYTLEQWWGPCVCAWESLSTLTGMGITLTATGPGVLGPVAQHQAEYQTQKMSSGFFWPAS